MNNIVFHKYIIYKASFGCCLPFIVGNKMIFKCNFHLLRRLCLAAAVVGGEGRGWDGFCGCAAVVHFCVLPVTAFAFASVTPLSAAPLAFMCVSVRQQEGIG